MKKKTILVVDDQPFFRAMLKEALSDCYQVVALGDGSDAYDYCLDSAPDLIVMDVEMPQTDGIETCRRLKSEPKTRHIPIVLFTSNLHKEALIRGLKAGADDYITKQACLPEVVARVDAHLRASDYYSELEHQDLLFLLELTERIFATRNPMTILRLVVDKLPDVIDVDRCSFVGLSDEGKLQVKASNDLAAGEEIQIDLRKYPEISRALETKRPVVIKNIGTNPLMESVRDKVSQLKYNAVIVIPMIKKESVIGTFFLRTASISDQHVSRRVFKLCQLVANLSANALENAILFESLKTAQENFEEMSIRDGLTRLYNHRHFYTRLQHEFSRALRYEAPLSMVFFDIDDFKLVNDRYGHTDGDAVLRKVGHVIRDLIRQSDVGARYGGDEFVILLPNTDEKGALEMAHRLQTAIRDLEFSFIDDSGVTVSIGIASYCNKNFSTSEQLVQQADAAMYRSKSQGKNQICRADPC